MKVFAFIIYAIIGGFLFFFSVAMLPLSLVWVMPLGWFIWRRYRTRDEWELLDYAKAQAHEEAASIRMQAAAEKQHRKIIEQAQRDAGLLPRKRSWVWYPFHVLANIGRELLFQPLKPWNPNR